MIINRHNYEEFFLMYVDNELDALQRAEVEAFVQQNADLRDEFDMLLQTRLEVEDNIEYAHKTELLKIKDSIGPDNYQEYFLLYIDNELNESSMEAVEKFVLQHPQLQDEFTLLKQTVLPEEKIVFHHKKSLYRKEEKRIVYFNWTRIGVAAAVIGVTALVWWIAPTSSKHEVNVATLEHNKAITPLPDKRNDTVHQPGQPTAKGGEQMASAQQTRTEKKVIGAANYKKRKVKPVEIRVRNNDNNIASRDRKITDDQPQVAQLPAKTVHPNEVTNLNPIIADIDAGNQKESDDPLVRARSTNAINTRTPKDVIQPVVYKELNTDDDVDANKGLYIGNMELNKNQVRGIIKKVGGLFSGKSKNASHEKGKLQVANFELNTN